MKRILTAVAWMGFATIQAGEVKNAAFKEGYREVVLSDPVISTVGGAGVVEFEGRLYFVAVGSAAAGDGSPSSSLNRVKVARIKALKAAAEYFDSVSVEATDRLSEEVQIQTTGKGKEAKSRKTLTTDIIVKLRSIFKSPPQVGVWENSDGSLFFLTLATPL